ncbi:hypothetical protein J6590_054327 [Homalodisca vitripennis]|nr:hypothetical protein J6590_054327 [Homalodisca vitripennis]
MKCVGYLYFKKLSRSSEIQEPKLRTGREVQKDVGTKAGNTHMAGSVDDMRKQFPYTLSPHHPTLTLSEFHISSPYLTLLCMGVDNHDNKLRFDTVLRGRLAGYPSGKITRNNVHLEE